MFGQEVVHRLLLLLCHDEKLCEAFNGIIEESSKRDGSVQEHSFLHILHFSQVEPQVVVEDLRATHDLCCI